MNNIEKIAYQGSPGSYSEELLKKEFQNSQYLSCNSFGELVDNVSANNTYGLLPVENSIAGTVIEAYEELIDSDLKIFAEYIKKIVKQKFGIPLYYTKKDIQSIVNNACGYYQLAMGHLLHDRRMANGTLKEVSDLFLDLFLDLNKTNDYKYNEYVLLNFFQNTDPKVRKAVPLPEIVSTEK